MFSYDHDLEEFVAIGLGTVNNEGTLLESNIGVGVIKAGWHGGTPPQGDGCASGPAVCGDYCSDPVGGCDAGCLPKTDGTPLPGDACQYCEGGVTTGVDLLNVFPKFELLNTRYQLDIDAGDDVTIYGTCFSDTAGKLYDDEPDIAWATLKGDYIAAPLNSCNIPQFSWSYLGLERTTQNIGVIYDEPKMYSYDFSVACNRSTCEKTQLLEVIVGERTTAEIRALYQILIDGGRTIGLDEASNNLEHFLSNAGGEVTMALDWLSDYASFNNRLNLNRSILLSSIQTQIATVPSFVVGVPLPFFDDIDENLQGDVYTEPDLFFASGGSSLMSTGNFNVTKTAEGFYQLTGAIEHYWYDPYDWDKGKAVWIEGFGLISDYDGRCMVNSEEADNFLLKNSSTENVSCTFQNVNDICVF